MRIQIDLAERSAIDPRRCARWKTTLNSNSTHFMCLPLIVGSFLAYVCCSYCLKPNPVLRRVWLIGGSAFLCQGARKTSHDGRVENQPL
jgi:hypothetical protein